MHIATPLHFEGIIKYEDTSNVTDMSHMFAYCRRLIAVPELDFSNVTNMSSMFMYCEELTTIPQINVLNVTNLDGIVYKCESLTTIHLININANIDISFSTKFTREALLEVIGNLVAQTSETKFIGMGSTNLAKLTDEDKAIATGKGWTLA